jgi:SAM-dependent methyltransferase
MITKSRHDGAIAQLVEHRTENPGVAGSIPAGTTKANLRSRIVNDLRDFFGDITIFEIMAIINEGLQYRLLIDPLLNRVHSAAAAMIEPGARVIDIACGNGTMALKMAKQAQHVTGIDLSEGSLQCARKRARNLRIENTEFLLGDANDLSAFSNLPFDIATISMSIHQFSPETGLYILRQLEKISRTVIVIDYAYPQPQNFYGFIVRTIERIAGREHFACFNAYKHGEGMPGILNTLGIKPYHEAFSKSGIFTVIKFG